MRYGDFHRRGFTANDFTELKLDGISVTLYRTDTEDGAQIGVQINTEDATRASDHVDGEPLIYVGLNDATLYDREQGDEQARVVPARWNTDAQAYEV